MDRDITLSSPCVLCVSSNVGRTEAEVDTFSSVKISSLSLPSLSPCLSHHLSVSLHITAGTSGTSYKRFKKKFTSASTISDSYVMLFPTLAWALGKLYFSFIRLIWPDLALLTCQITPALNANAAIQIYKHVWYILIYTYFLPHKKCTKYTHTYAQIYTQTWLRTQRGLCYADFA